MAGKGILLEQVIKGGVEPLGRHPPSDQSAVGQVKDPHDSEGEREACGQQEQNESIGKSVQSRH